MITGSDSLAVINIVGYIFVLSALGLWQFDQSQYKYLGQVRWIVLRMLSSPQRDIIAITLHALVTGVYFASFLLCLRWLIFSDDGGTLRKPIRRPFLIIAIVLLAFSVAAFGICVQRALFFSQGAYTDIPIYAVQVSNPRIGLLTVAWTLQSFLELSGLIITDGVLVCE